MGEDVVRFGYEVDYREQGREQVEGGIDSVTKKIKNVVKPTQNATKAASGAAKAFKNLWSALKRIIIYQGIRSVISALSEAFKTGVTDIYYYSKALSGLDASNVKGSMDSMATSILYVKNALGASLAPIINAVTPLFTKLADVVAVAANYIAMLFAYLNGQSSFTAAKKFATTFEKSLGSSTKAAQTLKNTLMGFDEINRLDDQSDSSSGSGYTSADYSNMFEEREVDAGKVAWIDTVKEKLKEAFDWLKENLNDILRIVGIIGVAFGTWKVIEKTAEVWEAVAALSNLDLFGSIPATAIMGAIAAIAGVAIIVTNIFDMWKNGVDWQGLIAVLAGVALTVGGIFAICKTFLAGELATMLASTLSGIIAIVAGIALFVVGIKDLIQNGPSLKAFAAIIAGIVLVVAGIALAFGALPAAIAAVVLVLVTIIITFRDQIKEFFVSIGTAIKQTFTVDLPNALKQLWAAMKAVPGELASALKQLGTALYDALIKPFVDAFTNIKNKATEFLTELRNKFTGWTANIKTPHISWQSGGYQTTGLVKKALEALNLPTALPKLNVAWYARGGIVDGATLIGAGERGAEAIVPLENNTEWLDKIAERLINAQGNQDIVLNVDGKVLFDILVDRNNSMVRRTGHSKLLV